MSREQYGSVAVDARPAEKAVQQPHEPLCRLRDAVGDAACDAFIRDTVRKAVQADFPLPQQTVGQSAERIESTNWIWRLIGCLPRGRAKPGSLS
jgi:hypothetical protein